jgi:hypothetical protein
MENIENWGGNSGGSFDLISDGTEWPGSSFYAKGCVFAGAQDGNEGNGLGVRDIGVCISENTSCLSNRRDGFNYHNYLAGVTGVQGLNPNFVEINCNAHGNGVGGSENNNQGSTAHENCIGFRINSDYSGHADGGNVVDIQGVKAFNVAITAKDSNNVGMLLSADGYDTGSGLLPAIWWIDGAKCSGNPTVANAQGDIALDGFYSVLHYQDTDTEKPLSTRTFSDNIQAPDEDFS